MTDTAQYTVERNKTRPREPARGLLRRDQPLAPDLRDPPVLAHPVRPRPADVHRARLPHVPPRLPTRLRRVPRRIRLPDQGRLPAAPGRQPDSGRRRRRLHARAHLARASVLGQVPADLDPHRAARRRPTPSTRCASPTTRPLPQSRRSRTSGPTSTTSAARSSSPGTAARTSRSAVTWAAPRPRTRIRSSGAGMPSSTPCTRTSSTSPASPRRPRWRRARPSRSAAAAASASACGRPCAATAARTCCAARQRAT